MAKAPAAPKTISQAPKIAITPKNVEKVEASKSAKSSGPSTGSVTPKEATMGAEEAVVGITGATFRANPAIKTIKTAPYELVKPHVYKRDAGDSWQSDDESMELAGVRRWMVKKDTPKARKTLVRVVASYTVLVVVILAALIAGAYFMYRHHQDLTSSLDKRLKTKTTACRVHQSSRMDKCTYELYDEELRDSCDDACGVLQWKFEYNEITRVGKIVDDPNKATPSLTPTESDYADCGDLKWCQKGKCVDSRISKKRWWPGASQVDFDSLFQDPQWIPVNRGSSTPCLVVPEAAAHVWNRTLEWYHDKCNTSTCDNTNVRYAVRLTLRHCNLDEDLQSGMRRKHCGGIPVAYEACDKCKDFSETSSSVELRTCPNESSPDPDLPMKCTFTCGSQMLVVPDGASCLDDDGGKKKQFCFMGVCVSDWHNEEDSDTHL